MEKCGCKIKYYPGVCGDPTQVGILYCPLHLAAGEILEALTRLLELCCMHKSDIKCFGADRDIDFAKAAILKAKEEGMEK